MTEHPEEQENPRDWRVSLILAATWTIALILVVNSELEIPVSMLVIASAFFVLLIPAMNDLVQTAERLTRGSDDSENSDAAGENDHGQ